MSNLSTLVVDIYKAAQKAETWEDSDEFSQEMSRIISSSLLREPTKDRLRLSPMGKPCKRQLWYGLRSEPESVYGKKANMFLYGDMLEHYLLHLAKKSGHKVEAEQQEVTVAGIKGHIDCLIDGVLIDVKSASPCAFNKFMDDRLDEPGQDLLGYLGQLTAYLHGMQDDPRLTDKTTAGFLVINKSTGAITLSLYDLSDRLAAIEEEIAATKELLLADAIPERLERPFFTEK